MVSDMAIPTKIKVETVGGFEKWQVEGWLDTLEQANGLKRDKKKMKAIRMLVVQKKRYWKLLMIK